MSSERFQTWLGARTAELSRRAALRAPLAAWAASIPGAGQATAKKNGKRRRRRQRERARARCLAACGPACAFCYPAPDGEVRCGQQATPAAGCSHCESDADCDGGYACVEGEQARGGGRTERFLACLYPNGLCAAIATCEPG